MSGFKAADLTIRDIFTGAEEMRMPPYQRGYSWGEKEAGELLSDIREASETDRPYFLGAMVVVNDGGKEPLEVVDGQQRLATLTILFAVLRDLAENRDEANRLHEMIEFSKRPFSGQQQQWRLTLNHVDTPFFRETVQKRGATREASLYDTDTESRLRILANVQAFRDALEGASASERTALARYVQNQCVMVRVVVGDRDGGYGAFRVLNTRGKQPSAADILKSDLFERAGFSDREAQAHAASWNEIGDRLGVAGFDDLLKQIRSLFDKATREDMVTGFRTHVLPHIPARVFVEDRLPRYAEAYEILSGRRRSSSGVPSMISRHVDFIRALEHSTWRAPALKYLVDGDLAEEPAVNFFKRLERLAFVMQFVVSDRDARGRRYRRVIQAIDKGEDLLAPDSPLSITNEEASRMSDRLAGRFATFRQRRAMSLRLNALLPGGNAISPDADATLEHVMPRNPKANSQWLAIWRNAAERREMVDCLGNFTLLKNAENQEADRQEFAEKKAIFFRHGTASYRMSDDIEAVDAWTPDVVRVRRDYFVDLLRREWQLEMRQG